MNQNYVKKCEEYLQNIPSQKLPPSSSSSAAGRCPEPNLSSRKLTQPGGLRPGRQSINNANPPVLPPPAAKDSRPKPKPPPPMTTGRRTPVRPPTARPGQLRSKFIRPCCRPKGKDTTGSAETAGRGGSDNVNQNDVRVMDETGAEGGGGKVDGMTGKTKTWDGILTAESTVDAASLTQIKSKATSLSPSEPSPITSTFPNGGVAPDSSNNHDNRGLTLAPNPSVTSLLSTVTSSSVRLASSSIAAVPPQPRPSSTVLATPVATEHRQPSSTSIARAEVNQQKQLQGINLFRFDPLRTLQFLTLELKSKLKPLLLTVPAGGDGGGNDDATSAHKQLYKISKELLYAVKLLTENAESQRKGTSDGEIPKKPSNCGIPEASAGCQNCLKLQNVLDRRLLQAEQPGGPLCLPRKEINYHQQDLPQPESSKSSTTDQLHHQLQLQLRLEGEIKRLQTMISDKQTTTAAATAATEGLINDLNRKLDAATHARDEAQRKLLYATLENERLNFLLRSQCSTMANLRHDFSAIQSLADQQIDLLDRTNEHDGGLNDRSRSKSNAIATTTSSTVVGNHHRNYRYPSGCAALQLPAQLNPTPTATVEAPRGQVAKLRHRHHHYSFQNIAEKESDDGNDAANDYYWRNSTSQSQQQQHRQLPQETKVMLRLPSSTLMAEGGAFQEEQQQGEERLLTTGLWQKKNRAADLEESGTSSASSLSVVVNAARSARFGPTKRTLLIDSDRDDDDDLKEETLEGQQQHSSSSISSLASSQQRRQRGRGQELNNNNGKDLRTTTTMTTISNRELPAFGDKPFTVKTKEDAENRSDYTNNNNNHHPHIQNSKTNDCVSLLVAKDDEMATNREQQQLSPGGGNLSKKKMQQDYDTIADLDVEAKGKYPRDYGDKFELRESLLALPRPGQEQKELCQNRPIMGQIRRRSSETGKQEKADVLVGKIISANEPASGQTSRTLTRTEEFSIDFDDITLPPSPIPFRRGNQGEGSAEEEFPSSFGDWM